MIRKLKNAPAKEPICGVFAATLATPDIPFCMVKTMAGEEMRRKRWRGAMHMPALTGLLERLGVGFKTLGVGGISAREALQMLDPKKQYILFVTDHFFTLHDGHGYDQSNPDGVAIEKFWAVGRRLHDIVEITSHGATYDELFPEG